MVTKKRVVRKTKQLKPKPPPHRSCSQQPCKKIAAYCRRENGEMVNYCVGHWKSVVESKKEFARQVVQHAKAQEKIRLSRPKKRLVKKKVKG